MFSYSTGYYVSPPDDQYLKFKNRCSLLWIPRYTQCNIQYLEQSIVHCVQYCKYYIKGWLTTAWVLVVKHKNV